MQKAFDKMSFLMAANALAAYPGHNKGSICHLVWATELLLVAIGHDISSASFGMQFFYRQKYDIPVPL
jgi:hypothetical protein